MVVSDKIMDIARSVLSLTLVLGTVDGLAHTFNFAWPAPIKGTVTWSSQTEGVTLVNESEVRFQRRADDEGFALVTEHQELVRVLGVPEAQERAMLADPQWILAMSIWPTYLISERGELQGLADLDLLTMNLIASADDATDAEKVRRFVRSDHFRQAVREQVTILWEGLIGAVAGVTLESGESITRSEEFPVHGTLVPVRVITTHLGPAREVKGAVRLQTVASFDETALKAVMSRALSKMLPGRKAATVDIERVHRKVVIDSVVSPHTLLPHSGRISEEVATKAANHPPVGSKLVHAFEFSWER